MLSVVLGQNLLKRQEFLVRSDSSRAGLGAGFGGIGKPGNPIRGPDHLIRKLRGGTLDAAANARALGGPQILGCLDNAGRTDVGGQVL